MPLTSRNAPVQTSKSERQGGDFSRSVAPLFCALAALAEFIMPVDCPCGVLNTVLCAECRLVFAGPGFRCDGQATALRRRVPSLPTFAGGHYQVRLRRVVLDFKQGGRLDLAGFLSTGLNSAWGSLVDYYSNSIHSGESNLGSAYLPIEVILVPIPTSARSRWKRGDDQVLALMRALRPRLTWPGVKVRWQMLLTVSSVAQSQKSRGLADRLASGAARFRLRRLWAGRWRMTDYGDVLRGKNCVVVDDVVTSGATLAAAAAVLEAQGATVLGAICVASTPRR